MEYVVTTLREAVTINQLITIYYFEFGKNYRWDGESHDFWELIYVDGGELVANIEDRYVSLRQGDILFYPPNYFHTHHSNGSEPANIMVVTFICHSKELLPMGNRVMHLNDQQAGLLSSVIREAQNAFSSPLDIFIACELIRKTDPVFGSEQLIRLNLEMLILDLIRNNALTPAASPITTFKAMSDNEKVSKMIGFLNDNVYKRVQLADVCAYTTLSPTNVKTIFKRVTGQSIMSYYTRLKITEAKRLIRKGFYSVNEIADMLAYTSVQYFSKHFKKETGLTPTQYASSIKAKSGFN